MLKISPSVLACDFGALRNEILSMEAAGADMIHLDVMDGHFVPNISFGHGIIAGVRPGCSIPFDVHLMISQPLRYIDAFAEAGADSITFHLESESCVEETIEKIRGHGKGVGLSLRPGTRVKELFPYLPLVDMVLVMTVEPGFGGQRFMQDQMPKVAAVAKACRELGLSMDIQVDGGIDETTAPIAVKWGANVLVAGSALFRQPDYGQAVAGLRRAAEGGVS